MAKRKRLSPAAVTGAPDAPLETKAMNGWVGTRARAPIADVASDSATQSAFEEVAEELRAARNEGRMVLSLPLSAIKAQHLVRDRVGLDLEELAVLKASLAERGQQTPVDVVDLGGGAYGLISGWRRYTALRELAEEAEQGEPSILALVRAPDGAAEAYKAMVEENEIRADLSFYERARIAVQAVGQGVYPDDKTAVNSLFSAARPAKRSKIISFTHLVRGLDDVLRFPAAVPEKVGLALVAALQGNSEFFDLLKQALTMENPQNIAAERTVLDQALSKIRQARPKPTKVRVSEPREMIGAGIALQGRAGKVTLSGGGVDEAFLNELRTWLAQRP